MSEGDKPRREFGNDYMIDEDGAVKEAPMPIRIKQNLQKITRPLAVPVVGPTGGGQEPLHANSGNDSSGKMEVIHRLSCRET